MPDFEIVQNKDRKRFLLTLDGHTAESEYIELPGRIIFTHTEVPKALEGKGAGSALAKHGLEYAKVHGLKVQTLCPFVAGYIKRHPAWKAILAPGFSVG